MTHKDMDSDFEAYREERNYRRRQRTKTERPHGSNKVWEELNAVEEGEIHDRLLTREVHDFFADATKMAADIVSKVTEEHEEAVGARLRAEMEEFLRETIRRASEFIDVLGEGGGRAEAVLQADMKNLVGKVLDEFRAEGTAQIEDKHLGQDPFKTDVERIKHARSADGDQDDDDLGLPTQRIDPSELALNPGIRGDADEVGPLAGGFDAKPEGRLDDPDGPADSGDQSKAPPKAMTEAELKKFREALKTMVRQGLMTKDEARETYRERTGASD